MNLTRAQIAAFWLMVILGVCLGIPLSQAVGL